MIRASEGDQVVANVSRSEIILDEHAGAWNGLFHRDTAANNTMRKTITVLRLSRRLEQLRYDCMPRYS